MAISTFAQWAGRASRTFPAVTSRKLWWPGKSAASEIVHRGSADLGAGPRRDPLRYRSGDRAARAGGAILYLSSSMDEVLTLGDHIAVIYGGRLSEPVPRAGGRQRSD